MQSEDPSGDLGPYLAALSSDALPDRRDTIRLLFAKSEGSATVREQILRLTENKNPSIPKDVDDHLTLMSRRDPEYAVRISRWLYKTENHYIRDHVAAALSLCAPEYPLECIKIGKQMVKGMAHISTNLTHLFEKVGEGELEKIRPFVEAWILEGQTGHLLTHVLFDVYRRKSKDLVRVIEGVYAKDKAKARTICRGLRALTYDEYRVHHSGRFFKDIEECATKAGLR